MSLILSLDDDYCAHSSSKKYLLIDLLSVYSLGMDNCSLLRNCKKTTNF